MQRLLLSSLSVLVLLASAVPTVNAQTIGANPSIRYVAMSSPELKPFNLVFLAYQGYFEKSGIASSGQFTSDLRSGKVTAKSLVQAAVNENKLPAQTLEDEEYLGSVTNAIQFFANEH
ncbi:hypothetical protein [Pseudanabaena sp. PCC 6802]|uniref:hypothetical protein n=1 Tax=Pseudanabaena sp. PCC 6802 TaxID=118173 RepID=UPI00034C4EC9|nr:hypothetical protein [Pseudanabaena sp. PCC 6802]